MLKARQILDEELSSPTVSYKLAVPPLSSGSAALLSQIGTVLTLSQVRSQRPRPVFEDPAAFRFESMNCDLLRVLLSQLSESARPQFLRLVQTRFLSGLACRKEHSNIYPKWDNLISELPLVVEFLTRNGGKEELFGALEAKDTPIIPGHVLMLAQIEDMIALNYTVFSDSEYDRLGSAVTSFGSLAAAFADKHREKTPGNAGGYGKIIYRGLGSISLLNLRNEIVRICNGIIEECQKAKYLYLKGSLLEGLNLEVNQDKLKVEGYLRRFGFTPLLNGSLDEADRLYHEQATPFDFKSSIGHIRSFLENLQKEAIPKIHAKYGGSLPMKWGEGLTYLLQQGILSKAEQQFAVHFFTLISDEGVHPLIAEREFARLARNMVIEYALLFLSKLEKLGLAL